MSPTPVRLERLSLEHGPAVLAFERDNRAYFARSVTDRGDDYFAEFDARHAALLAEQDAGTCAFHLALDDAGQVVGRFNLYDLQDGAAELGYRVAEQASGQGVASRGVRELCELARDAYGLHSIVAGTSTDNRASQRVLLNNGFVLDGTTVENGVTGPRFRLSIRSA